MQDFIPEGTGNSRFLKSVSDFLTRYPTYQDFAAALIAGTLPVDFNGYNNEGVRQTGTPYNKASVLTDETAADLGLTQVNPTVNDAFAKLAAPIAGLSAGIGIDGLTFNGIDKVSRYGVCTDSISASNKYVHLNYGKISSSNLEGARVSVFFTNGNSNTGTITLEVNGSDGMSFKADIYSPITSSFVWKAGTIVDFLYANNRWNVLSSGGGNNGVTQTQYVGNAIVVNANYVGNGGETFTIDNHIDSHSYMDYIFIFMDRSLSEVHSETAIIGISGGLYIYDGSISVIESTTMKNIFGKTFTFSSPLNRLNMSGKTYAYTLIEHTLS